MHFAQTDLVIFDCDGVLIDSEGLSCQVLTLALARLGVEIDFDYFCVNYLGRSFPTVAKDIRKTFAIELPESFERDYRAQLLAAFETQLQPTPGVVEAIRAIGLPVCVATSSSPERVSNSLRIAGLRDLFEPHVFTASEVQSGKPAPDLFLHVAREMGADPARCLVIEDSLPGVQAGVAAGMDVVRYTGGIHLRGRVLKHADEIQTFDNWPEIFQMRPSISRKPVCR
jgi:HAD superfamily hydrolase (TIGR01509 family)